MIWAALILKGHDKQNNGFERTFIGRVLTPASSTVTTESLKEIAGLTTNSAFIAANDPGVIYILSYQGGHLKRYSYGLRGYKHAITIVDSPEIIFLMGDNRYIAKGRLSDTSLDRKKINGNLFTRAIKVNEGKFILRQFESFTREQIFSIYYPDKDTIIRGVTRYPFMNDGGVLTDGLLLNDKYHSRVIYVYLHKGAFDCLDTNLTLKNTFATIDTFAHFQNKVIRYQSNGAINLTTEGPSMIVNKTACISPQFLFICSAVKANNESFQDFNSNATVDVYDLDGLRYRGSFRVPLINSEQMKGMKIIGNKLIAVYPHAISVFTVPLGIT